MSKPTSCVAGRRDILSSYSPCTATFQALVVVSILSVRDGKGASIHMKHFQYAQAIAQATCIDAPSCCLLKTFVSKGISSTLGTENVVRGFKLTVTLLNSQNSLLRLFSFVVPAIVSMTQPADRRTTHMETGRGNPSARVIGKLCSYLLHSSLA